MTHLRPVLLTLLGVFITAGQAAGQSASAATEILDNTHLLGNAPNIILTATMDIRSSRGDKSRTIDIYISQDEETSKILAQVSSPPFLRNLKFLTHQFANGSDDRWVKTSRGVRRLAEGNYGEALFDSDFTVEDLSRIDQSRFDLEVTDPGDTSGLRAVKATPTYKNPDYDYKIFLIETETGMLTGVDFYSGDTIVRKYTLVDRQVVDGELYPLLCKIEDFEKNTSTILEIEAVSIEDSIPARMFNRGSL